MTSTIVEIIRAYQPAQLHVLDESIYNSRNYQSLLARKSARALYGISTIVEIIRTYQPLGGGLSPHRNLQQQKLLEFTSLVSVCAAITLIYNSRNYQSLLANAKHPAEDRIYNSRNYQSLLAQRNAGSRCRTSTIVEIIRAYQPHNFILYFLLQSTIVEIIRTHQPYATAQGLLSIYNSRNYQSLLAQCQLILRITIYNSRNYQSLLAKAEGEAHTAIYNSRNYQNLLAPYRLQRYKKSFKQKHFLYLF